ncbi:MAG: hypothetical protein NTY09_07610 [bacterium]|nr:hypothetical protein [bacterium]
MNNLIRIKLDPRRGGVSGINFIRPCFVVLDWPGDEVDVWYSDDNGTSWDKLAGDDYRAGYDFESKRLYLTLLFDIGTISQIALYGSGGARVGIGYELASFDVMPVGWSVEGILVPVLPIGCSIGNQHGHAVGAGVTVDGANRKNYQTGFFVKRPNERNFAVGHVIAAPVDAIVPAGFGIGTIFSKSQGVGATIMGLSEYGLSFMSLDENAINAMSSEAVNQKQKLITFNGTDPEELD